MFALSSSTIYGWKTVDRDRREPLRKKPDCQLVGDGDCAIDNLPSLVPGIRIHGRQSKSPTTPSENIPTSIADRPVKAKHPIMPLGLWSLPGFAATMLTGLAFHAWQVSEKSRMSIPH